ncbi:DUF2860 family protein [Litoribacillus peritrichatus]|uniref:DUF2860 domain-containing protein n=1 Tax=Litoribacillus peritrichatus TaxID=718191 RepID=A0ABP7MQH9_9GAMM
MGANQPVTSSVTNFAIPRIAIQQRLLLISLITTPLSASFATELTEPIEPGFSGYVQASALISESKSLSGVSDDNETIDSLNQRADSVTRALPILLFELNYGFENQQTQLYVGTPEDNITEGNPLFEIGIRHQLKDGTLLTAALLPKMPGFDEVWQDPYQTGAKRKETDAQMEGFYFASDYILGGPVSLRYAFAQLDVDKERSGQSLINQPSGITAEESKQLQRDADIHQVQLDFTLPLMHYRLFVVPSLLYTTAEADGAAFDFDRWGLELHTLYTTNALELTAGVSYASSKYDTRHPVFNRTREDDRVSALAGIGFIEPFNWQNIRLDAMVSYSERDSNIAFYDSDSTMAMVGIAYSF